MSGTVFMCQECGDRVERKHRGKNLRSHSMLLCDQCSGDVEDAYDRVYMRAQGCMVDDEPAPEDDE